ncbi:MAG: PIG-L family deacetylase [Nitrosomonas sp.]|uniref:hypothetical protein n=1 Tax=Nitrosomonas sp. TaxID=42353 RepID=UPI001DD304F3|nr:hypothetical protein [Nitrosomonas sp.]MBX9895426.1 PIG-L family deacetylase [Nitrosomonas sp.]
MNLMRFLSFLVLSIFSCMLSGRATAALPQGFIDQVVLQNNIWTIKGWACQPYLGSAIKVQAYLNNVAVGVPINTNQPAEVAIHTACGTNITSGIKYRFEIALNSISSLSGQSIKVNAVGPGGTVALNRSNQFGLPSNSQTPDKVLAAANRILLIIAHQDDEILFSPFLGRYCGSKTCKIVTATNDSVRAGEWPVSMGKFPAQSSLGGFSWNSPNERPSVVLSKWNNEAASLGFINMNNIIKLEIDNFRPDVILTFDPRHGSSCHSEHRAVGEAVRLGVAAYTGTNFPDKSKLFFLTTRRVDGLTENGSPYTALVPIAPIDKNSVVYSANDFISTAKGTGWEFLINLMRTYPSQFSLASVNAALNTNSLERTTAFQRVTNYSPTDSRYTDAYLYDPAFVKCPPW